LKTLASVKEAFRDDYAKAIRPDDKKALARVLFDGAAANTEDATTQYVLLTEARNFAAEQLDFDVLNSVAALLAKNFDVDESTAAADGWDLVLAKPHTAALHKQVAETALEQLERAVDDERFAGAKRLSDAALAAARKANDAAIAKRANDRAKLFAEQSAQFAAVQAARSAVASGTADPAANTTLGRYLCFVRADWPGGFELLAKGNDPVLQSLAQKSLEFPVEASARTSLGDAWWNESAKAKDKALLDLRNGAAYWYSMAIPDLSGVEKVRVEQRLNEITAAASLAAAGTTLRPVRPVAKPAVKAKPVDVLKLINPVRDTVFTRSPWIHKGASLAMPVDAGPRNRLQIPAAVPPEYVFTVTASRQGTSKGPLVIGLVVGGSQCCVVVGGSPTVNALEMVDGKDRDGNETSVRGAGAVGIRSDRPVTIICSVRRTGVVITIDDKKVIDFQGDSRRLSLEKAFAVPNPGALFIGSDNGSFEFTKLELAPASD
jgi:hypothetical protein